MGNTETGVQVTALRTCWQQQQRCFCKARLPNYPHLYSEAYGSILCPYPTPAFISDHLQIKWFVPQLVFRNSQVFQQSEQITWALMLSKIVTYFRNSSSIFQVEKVFFVLNKWCFSMLQMTVKTDYINEKYLHLNMEVNK